MLNLVRDGMAVRGFVSPTLGLLVPNAGFAHLDFTGSQETYSITDKGRELVARLAEARSVD